MLRYTFCSTLLWSDNRWPIAAGRQEKEKGLFYYFLPSIWESGSICSQIPAILQLVCKDTQGKSRTQLCSPQRCHLHQSEMTSPSVSEHWRHWSLHPEPQAGCSLGLMCWAEGSGPYMSRSWHQCDAKATILPGVIVCGGHPSLSLVHRMSRWVQMTLPFTFLHVLVPEVGDCLS